jgi:cysteine desulfurase
MPIEEIGRIAAEKGVVFHSDAVQRVCKMPFDVGKCGVQLASISAHKINGPKGVGALYIRKGTKITSCQQGGHHENGHRAGTENIPAIAGFGKACEIAFKGGPGYYDGVRKLRDELYKRVTTTIEQTQLNGHPEKRLCNTMNISFNYLEGESVILSLDLEGIATSTGSACTSGSLESSHVLKSMGVKPLFAQGAVRFSLDVFNTQDDIDYVMEKLPPIIKRLREMSPVYRKE